MEAVIHHFKLSPGGRHSPPPAEVYVAVESGRGGERLLHRVGRHRQDAPRQVSASSVVRSTYRPPVEHMSIGHMARRFIAIMAQPDPPVGDCRSVDGALDERARPRQGAASALSRDRSAVMPALTSRRRSLGPSRRSDDEVHELLKDRHGYVEGVATFLHAVPPGCRPAKHHLTSARTSRARLRGAVEMRPHQEDQARHASVPFSSWKFDEKASGRFSKLTELGV